MSFSLVYEFMFPLWPCSKGKPHRNQRKGLSQAEEYALKEVLKRREGEKGISDSVHDPTQVS